ncbi:MAG: hypothetical protein P0Y49_09655 [Candidatus Pedobacter colombiensis]|uniref:Outer membrane protein beta-barrel domain-containing protein n=1 Tax=Candidatus Pedobacter colombiensis TaxID=3121371 RepID=A0AAJ5WCB5_9SPHI|nr:hypothetical protein [Pedobacter sp.]WEK21403.1 MAG: hypothetical protein P0Y49_09655 [Pedobacter sp.]
MSNKNWKFMILFTLSIVCLQSNVSAQDVNRKGYFNKTKVGFLPGLKDQQGAAFKQRGTEISSVNGYYVTPKLALGVGVGIAAYVNPTVTTIPVYIQANYDLTNGKSTPYLFGGTGYSFSVTSHTGGGLMAEGGLGWKIPIKTRTSISPELGYRYQRVSYDFVDAPGSIKDNLSSISIGVSLRF